jgi:hypothetical protein
MDRVKQGTAVAIANTWYTDGAVADPGTVTVGITSDDGTILVAPGTATMGTGAASRTFNLTALDTALLDILTVTWVSTLQGPDTSIIEIVGDFLFTIAQARAMAPLSNTTIYPTARIAEVRTLVETSLEDACGVAFVPRYRREAVNGSGGTKLVLSRPRVIAIRSVLLGGVVTSFIDIVPSGPGVLYNPLGWTAGFGNYSIAYEHGYPTPPPMATRAALTWAKRFLVEGPIDDRATSMSSADGTFMLLTPGIRGSVSGIPVVDAFIQQYDERGMVA